MYACTLYCPRASRTIRSWAIQSQQQSAQIRGCVLRARKPEGGQQLPILIWQFHFPRARKLAHRIQTKDNGLQANDLRSKIKMPSILCARSFAIVDIFRVNRGERETKWKGFVILLWDPPRAHKMQTAPQPQLRAIAFESAPDKMPPAASSHQPEAQARAARRMGKRSQKGDDADRGNDPFHRHIAQFVAFPAGPHYPTGWVCRRTEARRRNQLRIGGGVCLSRWPGQSF